MVKYLLILLALLLLVGGFVLYLWLRKKKMDKAAAGEEDPPEEEEEKPEDKALVHRRQRLRALFAVELRRLKQNSPGRDHRYRVPWSLLLSTGGAGQSTLLASTLLHSPFSADEALAQQAGCKFWYFDKGLAIDLDGVGLGDDETMATLQRLLSEARPKKPLDSLVLVIPATDVYGPDRLSAEDAQRKADFFYQRLQQLQQALTIRIPIYVLVSKADAIPGFSEFASSLSPPQREQMLGWSSPHDPEVPYKSAWIDEAVGDIYRTGCLLQLDLLARGEGTGEERDQSFLFLRHLRETGEPLRIFCDQIFKSNVYTESILMRGLYFCGDAVPEWQRQRASSQTLSARAAARRVSFLHHLFGQKVFAERGLCRPLSQSLAASSRMVQICRWAVIGLSLICLATLWSVYVNLSEDTLTVKGFLEKIPTDSAADSDAAQPDRKRFADRAQNLLNAMANLSVSRLRRVRIPSSWFSSIDDDIRDLMRDSFDATILSGLRYGLEYKAKRVFNPDGTLAEGAAGAPGQAADSPSRLQEGLKLGAKVGVQVLQHRLGVQVEDGSGGGQGDPSEDATQAVLSGVAADKDNRVMAPLPKVQGLGSMQEFQQLAALASAYREFTRNVDLYNSLVTDRRKRMDTLAPLVKYVFDINLGDGFTQNSAFFEEALANSFYKAYDMSAMNPQIQDRAKMLLRALERHLFLENPVDQELDEIQKYVTRFKAQGEWGGADLITLMRLRDTIQKVGRDVDRRELAWMGKEALDIGDVYRDLLLAVGRLLDASDIGEVETEWRDAYKQMRRRLYAHQAAGIGPLLSRDSEDGHLVLVPALLNLKNSLDGFLGQNYVQMSGDRPPSQPPEGASRVSWNEDLLRQAIALSDTYSSFVHDRLGQFPDSVRDFVKNTALDRLGHSMPSLVAQARKLERVSRTADIKALQDDVNIEVADLKRVATLLRQLLETYERLGLKAPRAELYQQVQEDTRELMRRLDLLLDKDEMYKVSARLTQWRGQRPPALDAFDADDADGLTQYLKAQRARMKTWARDYATTPVSLLEGLTSASGSAENDPVFLKWQRIVAELDHFEKMTPGNSVKEMETFIESTLMGLTPDNCLDKLPRRIGETPDYFLQTRARVYDAVRKRCVQFSEERLLDGYDRLAKHFNKDIAGRFPFSRNATGDEEEADPRDVRGFLQEFDDYVQKYDSYAGRGEVALQPAMVASQREIGGFLDSVRAVRPFFAPLISDKTGDVVPRYSLGVEFRVNKQNEINGSQIVEWVLSIADQRIDENQAQSPWQLGDKIRLTFRWAKDGLFRPSPINQAKEATVDKNDAINFEWSGRWAILRFLRTHKSLPGDLRKSLDRNPHILKFVIEIEDKKKSGRIRLLPESFYQREAQGEKARNSYLYNKAIVFVRFGITLPDSKEPIVLLSDWPFSAPALRGPDYK